MIVCKQIYQHRSNTGEREEKEKKGLKDEEEGGQPAREVPLLSKKPHLPSQDREQGNST